VQDNDIYFANCTENYESLIHVGGNYHEQAGRHVKDDWIILASLEERRLDC
jgi:hypothetical protein